MLNKTMVVSERVLSPEQARAFVSAHEQAGTVKYMGATWTIADIEVQGSGGFIHRIFKLEKVGK